MLNVLFSIGILMWIVALVFALTTTGEVHKNSNGKYTTSGTPQWILFGVLTLINGILLSIIVN